MDDSTFFANPNRKKIEQEFNDNFDAVKERKRIAAQSPARKVALKASRRLHARVDYARKKLKESAAFQKLPLEEQKPALQAVREQVVRKMEEEARAGEEEEQAAEEPARSAAAQNAIDRTTTSTPEATARTPGPSASAASFIRASTVIDMTGDDCDKMKVKREASVSDDHDTADLELELKLTKTRKAQAALETREIELELKLLRTRQGRQ